MTAAALRTRRLLAAEVVQTSAMDCGPAALKCLLEGFGRFLQKNFPSYNAATGRIRISHLGKSGWRSKRCSTSCIAFLPNAIPF